MRAPTSGSSTRRGASPTEIRTTPPAPAAAPFAADSPSARAAALAPSLAFSFVSRIWIAVRSNAPTDAGATRPGSARSRAASRNFGPRPWSSQTGSTAVSSMIRRTTSAGTVTPAS